MLWVPKLFFFFSLSPNDGGSIILPPFSCCICELENGEDEQGQAVSPLKATTDSKWASEH